MRNWLDLETYVHLVNAKLAKRDNADLILAQPEQLTAQPVHWPAHTMRPLYALHYLAMTRSSYEPWSRLLMLKSSSPFTITRIQCDPYIASFSGILTLAHVGPAFVPQTARGSVNGSCSQRVDRWCSALAVQGSSTPSFHCLCRFPLDQLCRPP